MATDGTQYLIELAAKFSGGDAAVNTLANLGDRMLAAGAKVSEFESATKAITKSLESAAEAATHAGDAVAEGEAKYRAAEVAADRAAKAVERIGQKAQDQVGKLQAALDAGDTKKIEAAEAKIWAFAQREQELVGAANSAAAALKNESAAIDALKSKASDATAKHADMKKGLANVKEASDKAAKAQLAASGTGKVNEMAEAFGKLGGPAGVAGQKVLGAASGFTKLRTAMGAAGPYAAIAVAVIAIASAAVLASVGIASWAVSMTDANRTQSALAAGIARSTKGGADLEASIDKINRVVPLSTEELTGMAKGLADGGLRGAALTAALEHSAVAAAKLKFGPDFQKQLLSLDFQAKRFGSNISAVFGDLKIEGLLSGLETLIALFDTTTSSGSALKFLFEAIFQPLINAAVAAVPKVERLFLYLEILALKAFIALKPYGFVFEFIGKAMLVVAGVIVGALVAAFVVLAAIMAVSVAIWTGLAFAVYGLVSAIIELVTNPVAALKGFVNFMTEIGTDMINGLVKGIKFGAGAVYDAMANVVNGAIDGAKKLLGIASPSAVFASIGDNTAAGFSKGVEGGAADAQGALEAMVAPPEAAATGARAGAGGGVTLNIAAINVNGQNAKEQALDFVDQLTQMLENLGITVGGGEAPAHA